MGKLYVQIREDINNINKYGNLKDLKSMLITSISLSRINALFNRIDTYYNENHPNEIYEHLSVDNLDEVETKLNAFEDELDIEGTNEIVSELNKIKGPDLAFLDSQDNEVYMQFALMDDAVKKVIDSHYQNIRHNDNNDPNNTPRQLIINLQKEARSLLEKGESNGVINKNTDLEYQFMQEFIKSPAKNFVQRYNSIFKFNSLATKDGFIKDIDESVFVKDAGTDSAKIRLDLLRQLEKKGKFAADEISKDVKRVITLYYKARTDAVEKDPRYNDSFPSLGKFLHDVKENLTSIVIDDDVELATDKPSQFIKDFLNDPIDGYKKYLDEVNDNDKSFKEILFEEEEVGSEDFTNTVNEFKENILNERDNYNNAASNKENTWKNHQEYKKEWFIKCFNIRNNNRSIDEVLNANKGGFFERLFKTTSDEYKKFSAALDNIRKDGVLKGDLDGLKKLAQKYLNHKLKDYDPFTNSFDEGQIENLDSTSKGRVRLCLSVIDSIKNAKEAVENRLDPKKFMPKQNIISDNNNEYLNNKINDSFHTNLKLDSEIENIIIDEEVDIDSNEIDNNINLNKN